MYNLKFDSFCIDVTDYCTEYSLLVLDINLKNSSTLQSFLNYYENHRTNSTSIDYELDETQYHGHFGLFVYDENFKARIYMTTAPDDYESYGGSYNIFAKNIISILNNHKNAMEIIINSLKQNELLSILELASLSDCLPDNDYDEETLCQKVVHLEDYLKVTKKTLDSIRNNEE